ncbi:hypothetical protein [Streptomyces niveus]
MVLLAGAGVALAVLGALAANAATSDARWPGVLDLLRRNSWESVAGTALLAVLVAAAVAVRQEKPAAAAGDPPPPEPQPVADWVVDRGQGDDVVAAVCGSGGAVGITTSLSGAGGFGKTTLAGVCAPTPRYGGGSGAGCTPSPSAGTYAAGRRSRRRWPRPPASSPGTPRSSTTPLSPAPIWAGC